jgi:4-amino-4-deoxy-L-arabinose transferase-like glycosyltransferase
LKLPPAQSRDASKSDATPAHADFQPRPLALWQIFPLIFICVYLTHLTLLRLPYYWDEAGYYIPAAYDFLRTGSLIPYSTLSNAHPPLPSLYLALWWKTSGFLPAVTRVAMCIVSSLALLGVYQMALRITHRVAVAAAVTALTLLYPVWFAQSTLAHADIFAAAATLWALSFCLRAEGSTRRYWIAACFFAIAALSKETAIVTSAALAIGELFYQHPAVTMRLRMRRAVILLTPLLPLAAWYAYHHHKTGFIFGNPEYLRYNATATFSALRVAVALGHRIFHLTAHMNIFVPVLCTAAAWMLPPRRLNANAEAVRPLDHGILVRMWTVLAANTLFFSIIGGALLTRYLLPLYPLVLLLCVCTWYRRVNGWGLLLLLSAVAFVLGIFINPPYRFAPEDNLSYRDMIVLQQQAIHQIAMHYPQAIVLTAWPATDELSKPMLGYVHRPYPVVAINDFSMSSIQRAGQSNLDYSVALVFSTKYAPPNLPFSLGEANQAIDARYFNGHQDLPPDAIARLLDGKVVWHNEQNGQWAALLHFDRPQLASLQY